MKDSKEIKKYNWGNQNCWQKSWLEISKKIRYYENLIIYYSYIVQEYMYY